MPIQVTTVYTKDVLLKYHSFTLRLKRYLWVFLLCGTLLLLGEWMLVERLALETPVVKVCLLLMLWLDLVYLLCYLLLPRLTFNKAKILNTVVDYTFEEDCFHLRANNPYATESSTVKYAMLTRVGKRAGFMYLFISRAQAYIVDLSSLSDQQLSCLRATLETQLPAKKIKWFR